ncbi:hypothetical protein [Streptomyces djakartensis]|uniref:hypothetical protein n=1 Tax=Streptomyces djakartensis TaxID=68193 RepID=UPI0034DF9C8E
MATFTRASRNLLKVTLTGAAITAVTLASASTAAALPSVDSTTCASTWTQVTPYIKMRSCIQRATENLSRYDRAVLEVKNDLGDWWVSDVKLQIHTKTGANSSVVKSEKKIDYKFIPGGTTTRVWLNDNLAGFVADNDSSLEFVRVDINDSYYPTFAPDSPAVN